MDLTSPGKDFTQVFWVKIAEPQGEQVKPFQKVEEEEKIGLPQLVKVYSTTPEGEDRMTWDKLEATGISMDYDTVVYPLIDEGVLQAVYINMDSSVIKNYRTKLKTHEQYQIAYRRYVSSVYFHMLFLYAINKQRGYRISKGVNGGEDEAIDLADYLKDLFSSNYAAFLLGFGMEEIVEALG